MSNSQPALPLVEAELPTEYGDFRLYGYTNPDTGEELVGLGKGELNGAEGLLMRVHSECRTGDVFGSLRCDCGPQLKEALKRINTEGRGLLVYLNQEGRGIGLINKIRAYALQEQGADTVDANRQLGFEDDLRQYHDVPLFLNALGVQSVRLMTNNPDKLNKLAAEGVVVTERVPIVVGEQHHNRSYLYTKFKRMGHMLKD